MNNGNTSRTDKKLSKNKKKGSKSKKNRSKMMKKVYFIVVVKTVKLTTFIYKLAHLYVM